MLAIARTVLRGVLPYPDPLRRVRVRRSARDVASRALWPQNEAAVTGLDYARLALLRLLWLQQQTRRAVRTGQRESAALVARTAMETCILGLWCLRDPDAVRKLRMSEVRAAPAMLTFLSITGILPQELIKQAIYALGEPEKLPDVRSMTSKIDAKTGATLAIHLYDLAYRPASQYFTHATSSALLRHVTTERRRTIRPSNPWVRRAPVRLADACVGLLAGAIANQVGASTELFAHYGEDHARRVLPPLLVTIGKAMVTTLSFADVLGLWRQALEVKKHLSRSRPDEAPAEREACLRALYDMVITRLDLDVPSEAIQPIIDYIVVKVLVQWDAEFVSRSSTPSGVGDVAEA